TGKSSSFILSCIAAILLVIGKQTVSQFVNTKSAIHQVPSKSFLPNVSLCWLVKEKSATLSSIFVSIGNLSLHAVNNNNRPNNPNKTALFFIFSLLIKIIFLHAFIKA